MAEYREGDLKRYDWAPVGEGDLLVTAPSRKKARKFMSEMLPNTVFNSKKRMFKDEPTEEGGKHYVFHVAKDFEHDPTDKEIDSEDKKLTQWNFPKRKR